MGTVVSINGVRYGLRYGHVITCWELVLFPVFIPHSCLHLKGRDNVATNDFDAGMCPLDVCEHTKLEGGVTLSRCEKVMVWTRIPIFYTSF